MSHFSVLVITKIGESVDDALFPFWELDLPKDEVANDPRAVPQVIISDDKLEESFNEWKKNPSYCEEYKDKSAEYWVCNWHEYRKVPGGYGWFHNPNAKWDWFEIGGRWSNDLITKSGQRVDQAAKKNIDFEEIDIDRALAAKQSWEKFISEEKDINDNFARYLYGVKDGDNEEKYVVRESSFRTYAVVKDGKWYAKGDMGWFGCSDNEKDNWNEIFDDLIRSADDDSIFTIVDCHI